MRALAALGLMVVSCTFPAVTYDGDASVPIDASNDATVDAGGDAQPPGDAGGDAPFDPCDKDHDGYRSTQCEGGTDCNDEDPRVNPGVTQFITDIPDAAPWGDWNCDGNLEYQYNAVTCGLTSCSAQAGFTSPAPGCGFTGGWQSCTYAVGCTFADAGSRTQGCR